MHTQEPGGNVLTANGQRNGQRLDGDRRREEELIERPASGRLDVTQLLAQVWHPASTAATEATTDHGGRDARAQDVRALPDAVAALAARLLGRSTMDPDTDFFEAGGSSVDAVAFAADLARELGLQISLDDVFSDARPRRIAERHLAATRGALTVHGAASTDTAGGVTAGGDTAGGVTAGGDLDVIAADLGRAESLPWVGAPDFVEPRRILLTGATGFLGSHLLLDLLRRSDAHVVCLVRASDVLHGVARLGEAFARFDLPWSAEIRRRVTVVPGDLSRPRLGLRSERWDRLAEEVDSVVNAAAAVDFLRGYPSLRHANVLGPLTLAHLAATGRPKPLHHVSSLAVFNEPGSTGRGEDDPVAHIDQLVAGYDKSKWAAEAVLRRARDHGLVVTLLRPGGVGGHTVTGAYNPQDLSSGLLAAFSRFRTVPAFGHLNIAPVDWVSQVAAAIVSEPEAWGGTYHLTGVPSTLDDVVHEMALGGMNVEVLGWDEWRSDTLARLSAQPLPQLDFLARLLQSPTAVRLCEATLLGPAATGERTRAFTAAQGLPAPAMYGAQAQLKTYERMADDGLARLPQPDDPPYLSFPETLQGWVGAVGSAADSPCTLNLTVSIASMHQLLRERRVDVRGQLSCPLVHPEPLTVEQGDMWVRPHEGVPLRHGVRHPLLRYRLTLRDAEGRLWWLDGHKTARARRDLVRQTRALAVQIGRDGQEAMLSGEVVVPGDTYMRQQVDGIQVNPALSSQEQRVAKLTWLAWFGSQIGRGLLDPLLRAGADLLDARRIPTSRTQRIVERDR